MLCIIVSAVTGGSLSAVKLIIDSFPAPPSLYRLPYHVTVLHLAAAFAHTHILQAMIGIVEFNTRNIAGENVLHSMLAHEGKALPLKKLSTITMLRRLGANPNQKQFLPTYNPDTHERSFGPSAIEWAKAAYSNTPERATYYEKVIKALTEELPPIRPSAV